MRWDAKIPGSVSAEFVGHTTAVRISAGAQLKRWNQKADLLLDGSYIAQKAGRCSCMRVSSRIGGGPAGSPPSRSQTMPAHFHRSVSNASAPPHSRAGGSAGSALGKQNLRRVLDGPRIARNTIYDGLRITLSPLPGLEIGIARTDMMCGTGHPCQPLAEYFDLNNSPQNTNKVNDEGLVDVKYSRRLFGTPFEIYGQLMNEDNSPFVHSGTSHLIGGSIWPHFGNWGARLTAEYTSSIPTLDIFSFGQVKHGYAYTNFSMRTACAIAAERSDLALTVIQRLHRFS